MKKVINLAVGIFIGLNFSFAQSYVSVGTGISFQQISEKNNLAGVNGITGAKTSPFLAVGYGYHFTENWSLKTGVEYDQKGFSLNEGTNINLLGLDLPIGVKAEASLNYIELPLLMRYSYGTKSLGFYAQAGAVLNYGISGEISPKANFIIDFNLPSYQVDFTDNGFRRMGSALQIGLGSTIGLTNGDFIDLGVNYQKGLSSIYETPIVDTALKASDISLGISYAKNF